MGMQDRVILHPLVLFSAIDHFKRVSSKNIVGIILGSKEKHSFSNPKNENTFSFCETHLINSFAIPFEVQDGFWFYDTSYFEKFLEMQYKVNPSEKLLGW